MTKLTLTPPLARRLVNFLFTLIDQQTDNLISLETHQVSYQGCRDNRQRVFDSSGISSLPSPNKSMHFFIQVGTN